MDFIAIPLAFHFRLLFQSVQAAVTNYCSLSAFHNKYLFFTVLEAGRSTIKVLADLVLGEGHFLVCIQLSSHCILTWKRVLLTRAALAALGGGRVKRPLR